MGNGGWFPPQGVKRLMQEAEQTPSPSAEVKNAWPLFFPYTFVSWYRHKDNFI
jgi:hypothetical protein